MTIRLNTYIPYAYSVPLNTSRSIYLHIGPLIYSDTGRLFCKSPFLLVTCWGTQVERPSLKIFFLMDMHVCAINSRSATKSVHFQVASPPSIVCSAVWNTKQPSIDKYCSSAQHEWPRGCVRDESVSQNYWLGRQGISNCCCLFTFLSDRCDVMRCQDLLVFFSFFFWTGSVPQICSSSILNVSCIKFDQPFPPSAPVSYVIPMSLSFRTSYRQLSPPATVLCRWS